MGLNTLNEGLISFKKISGKAHTQENFAVTEEGISSNIQISYSTIFANQIESLPITNSGLTALYATNGKVQRIKFQVDLIPNTQIGVNQSQGYQLKLPADWNTHPGALYPTFTAGTYLNSALGKLQIVPTLYGKLKSDGSTEYDPILFQTNGSTIINKFDPINWLLDPYSGVLFVQDPPAGYDISSNRPGYVEAFLYVGDYIDNILNIVSSGTTGTTASNVGTGAGIFKIKVGQNLEFKSLIGSGGILVTGTTNNIVIDFTGGTGGGTITGATNGLSVHGKNIGIGGTTTGNTTINTSHPFNIESVGFSSGILYDPSANSNTGTINIYTNGFNQGVGIGNNAVSLLSGGNQINVGVSGITVAIDTGTTSTLSYVTNYSNYFKKFSLVDVNFVTGKTSGSVSTTLFNLYTGTTAPATYALKSKFNTYTGTTAPATYALKANFNTYTGTTAPATYETKANFNSFTGGTSYIKTVNNGLTKSGSNAHLGGTLTGNTTLSTSNNTTALTFALPITITKTFTGNTAYFTPQFINVTDYPNIINQSPFSSDIGFGVKPQSNNFLYYSSIYPDDGSKAIDLIVLGNENNTGVFSEIFVTNTNTVTGSVTGTSYNYKSGNYTGSTIPVVIDAAILLNNNDVWYTFSDNGGGIGHFKITTKGNKLFTNTSGNYTGSAITNPASSFIGLSDDGVTILFGSGSINKFNTSTLSNVFYSSTSGNYTGTTMQTGGVSSASISNGFLYVAFSSGLAAKGIWKLNLTTNGAITLTTTSANYNGDILPSDSIGQSIIIGSDVWFLTGGGLWKYVYATNTGTKYTNSTVNYSGDKISSSLNVITKMIFNVTNNCLAFYDNGISNIFEFNTSTLTSTKYINVNAGALTGSGNSPLLFGFSDDFINISDSATIFFNPTVYVNRNNTVNVYHTGFIQTQTATNYTVPSTTFATSTNDPSLSSAMSLTDAVNSTVVNKGFIDSYLNFATGFTISTLFGLKNIHLDNKYVTGITSNYGIRIVTGNTTINSGNQLILVDTSISTIIVTLPSPSTLSDGKYFIIKDKSGNASSKNITVNGNGNNIDGGSSSIINTNYGSITVTHSAAANQYFVTAFVS